MSEDSAIDLYVDRIASHVAEGGWVGEYTLVQIASVLPEHIKLIPRIRAAIPAWVWRDSDKNYNEEANRVEARDGR